LIIPLLSKFVFKELIPIKSKYQEYFYKHVAQNYCIVNVSPRLMACFPNFG